MATDENTDMQDFRETRGSLRVVCQDSIICRESKEPCSIWPHGGTLWRSGTRASKSHPILTMIPLAAVGCTPAGWAGGPQRVILLTWNYDLRASKPRRGRGRRPVVGIASALRHAGARSTGDRQRHLRHTAIAAGVPRVSVRSCGSVARRGLPRDRARGRLARAIGGAIDEFSGLLATSPGAIAVIYSCGYAETFNDRPFLLPVSVSITRPPDVLTQGVLAKYLIDVITRGGVGPSVVAIDVVPVPESAVPMRLDVLIQDSLPNDLGMIGVSQSPPGNAPTPLAVALVAGLKGPDVQTGALLTGVQRQLAASNAVTVAAQHLPVTSGFLVGAPPPPPPLPPAVAVTAPPAVAATAPAPTPAPPSAIAMPAEEQMSATFGVGCRRRSRSSAIMTVGSTATSVPTHRPRSGAINMNSEPTSPAILTPAQAVGLVNRQ